LGPRRGLDAAERPQPGRGIAGPHEPQDRAIGARVLILTDQVVVEGPDVDRRMGVVLASRRPAVADEVVDDVGPGIGLVGLVLPAILGLRRGAAEAGSDRPLGYAEGPGDRGVGLPPEVQGLEGPPVLRT